jgi:hypothetical protein
MPDMPMNDMQLRMGTGAREYPVGPMPDMRMSNPGRIALEATQGVVPEPNYSGGLGSLMGGMNDSVSYSLKPPPSGFGPLQQQNPQLLAQMEMAKAAEVQRAAQLQQMKQNPSSSYSWNNGLWNA